MDDMNGAQSSDEMEVTRPEEDDMDASQNPDVSGSTEAPAETEEGGSSIPEEEKPEEESSDEA